MRNCQKFWNLRENLNFPSECPQAGLSILKFISEVFIGHRPGIFTRNSKSHAPAAPTRIFCPIIFITSSPITQPTPPRIKAPTTTPHRQHFNHHHRGISSIPTTNTKTTLNTTKAYICYIHSQNGQSRYLGRRLQV